MRFLNQLKETIYYAKYLGKEEVIKTVGGKELRTGSYEITYDSVQSADVYVSIPKGMRQGGFGKTETTERGNVTKYNRHIVSEKDLGLTVNDVMWIGIETTEQPNYCIQSIGQSYHHTVYLVKELP